ncbi:MAG: hydrogenase [Candidatus Thermoplasmatota archaeon]|nr:hydrogenase [Candidatus Thermoplasmatota archaeon]
MFGLESGSGFWNPVLWGCIIFIAFLLLYGIRGFGRSTYKKGTEQESSFLSGNPESTPEEMQVKASNLYWGFTSSMKTLYNGLRSMHTGDVGDYVLWFIIILAILFVVIGVM